MPVMRLLARLPGVRLAHVRERYAPAGTSWRLAAALDARRLHGSTWRWRAAGSAARTPGSPTTSRCSGAPVTTLDDHLAAGGRVAHLAALVEPWPNRSDTTTKPSSRRATSGSVRRSSARRACATSTRSRATSGRCGSVVASRSRRRGTACRSSTSATSPRSAGPDDPVWAPAGSTELDYELEVAALVDTPARDLPADRAEEAIGGYMIFNDWSARDLQRDETTVRLGPAKGKDFASSIGPWLVTPDELADARGTGDGGPTWSYGRGQRPRDLAAAAGRTRSSRSGRCSNGHQPT